MKHKTLIIFLFIVFVCGSFVQTRHHHVKHVFDGDTILIDTNEKVRYLGIDAPEIGYQGEKSEFMALESKDFNLHLIGMTRVRLELDLEKKDRHGRLLAYVYLETGEMVNCILLRKGLAHIMVTRPNLKYLDLLLKHQRLAMVEKLGIWCRDLVTPPITAEKYYLGSSKSYRFHRPGCPFAGEILPRNLVRFKSRREAFWVGFSPCKRCRP
jgi:endonuclease YncB( thermonuclease family)